MNILNILKLNIKSITIVYPYFLFLGIALTALVAIWRWFYYKEPVYIYSSLISIKPLSQKLNWYKILPYLLRLFCLLSLVLAISRFRIPDQNSKISVQGIDIMLVLDVSGSMNSIDDPDDLRTRFEVAKSEALKFIKKRDNDAIGLVMFGGMSVSRSPLTVDKSILTEILESIKIGEINPTQTVLSAGILTALNRLKHSTAKSKIVIALTDGIPTINDIEPEISIDLAKKLGVKVYTIGIGSNQLVHPFGFVIPNESGLNIPLLKFFASETGGQFFLAKNPQDVERIYSTINNLEKTDHEMPVYSKYFEFFMYFLWAALVLLFLEIVLNSLIWLNLG